jgi:hypothetical protein
MKVKAHAAKSFTEALAIARNAVDERQGLIVISGSQEMVSAYWHSKGIKKV